MAIPLLTTKLYIPPLPSSLTPRPHLVERLNAGLEAGHKLTLVSAPAGFGKTTLLCEWFEHWGKATTGSTPGLSWLSLDESDNDPARFWSYLIGALQTVHPSVGEAVLPMLDSLAPSLTSSAVHDGAGGMQALLVGLINELVAAGPEPLVLILDDLHVLHERRIHDALAFLVEHLPPHVHVVLASRADPPWPLARLRARRQMTELRTEDLRFSPDEAATFMNHTLGIELPEKDVATLDDRTEGWIVGLQLAALALQRHPTTGERDRAAFVRDFGGSHRFVLDYLVEEVLGQQPDEVQTFLLRTSILERMTAPLCDALLQDVETSQSHSLIEYLEQSNLFIVPLDTERCWYRYHHLFADLLRSRLDDLLGSRGRAPLHLRASKWYEGAGLFEEAIEHALAGSHHERAADLIEAHAGVVSHRGAILTLHRWLEALPETVVGARPRLCAYFGSTWLYHSLEKAQAWADATQEALAASTMEAGGAERADTVRHYVRNLRATIAFLRGDDRREVLEATQRALALIPPEQTPPYSLVHRLGDIHKDLGQDEAAEQAYLRAAELALAQGHISAALQSVCGRVLIARRYGRLSDAVAVCREALRSVAEPVQRLGKGLPAAGLVQILLGRILLEWNELDAAEQMLRRGLDQSALHRGHVICAMGAVALARTYVAAGRGVGGKADSPLDLDELLGQPWSAFDYYVTALRAWIVLLRVRRTPTGAESMAEWQEVLHWARNRPLQQAALDRDIRAGFLQSRLLIEAFRTYGEPHLEPVLKYLDEQFALIQAKGWVELMIDASIQQAMAHQALGHQEQATAALLRALELAEPGGWVRTFVDEGAPVQRLLSAVNTQMSPRRSLQAYIGKLLSALEREATPTHTLESTVGSEPTSSVVLRPSSPLPDPLSARERDVLRLLPTHLSSSEIARELYVSRNTVRSHIGHIYDKLGAHSRAEAVARAQELGLL